MPETSTEIPIASRNPAQTAGDMAKAAAHSVSQTVGNTVDRVMGASAKKDPEPRWPGTVALLAVCGLRFALPEGLSVGPNWLLLIPVAILLAAIIMTHRKNARRVNEVLGYVLNSLVTLDMVASLFLLVAALPSHKESPLDLLRSAAALWVTNIIVFASWYWRLDGGGPNARDLQGVHTDGAFLFPQMTLAPNARVQMGEQCWSPGFIDYLFVAFNTSTAFSPTDCPVLSRWAKVLMMIQALISFSTVVLLAARAVNIL